MSPDLFRARLAALTLGTLLGAVLVGALWAWVEARG